jgi:membrane dipeptidase
MTRRDLLKGAGAAALGLAACTTVENPSSAAKPVSPPVADLLARTVTVDIHSHAGAILKTERLQPVAAPMREGSLAAVGLAITGDWGTVRKTADGRMDAYRTPAPGELYRNSRRLFARVDDLVRRDGLSIIREAADFLPAGAARPGVMVSAEGGDFLDTDLDRIDEAYETHALRLLQLTHYRVNELGDIQTAPPEHGGLTDFGVAAIRRCNRLGVVVDVAHGPFDLVKRAVEVTDKPLVLSHTSLSAKPGPRSRTIGVEHARLIASTGGVIGIWPPQTIFPDIPAYARGIARMADAVGVDHVGIGSDQLGLPGGSAFGRYEQLPELAAALLATGFSADEAAKIFGGNFVRAFAEVRRRAA